ncbi:MAG: hypothetical protein AAF916_11210 [Planctomycetota bacterium]
MKPSRIALLALAFVLAAAGWDGRAAQAEVDPATEPPLRVVLHIEDRAVDLLVGQAEQIDLPAGEARVLVEVQPNRRLDLGSLAFDYPAHFEFTYRSPSPQAQRWTVSGDDIQVSVDRLGGGITIDAYRDQLQSTAQRVFGADLVKTEPISHELGGRILTGFRHTTRYGIGQVEQTMRYDYLFFDHGGQAGCLLTVYPPEASEPDGVYTRVRRQIADSWVWGEAAGQPANEDPLSADES